MFNAPQSFVLKTVDIKPNIMLLHATFTAAINEKDAENENTKFSTQLL